MKKLFLSLLAIVIFGGVGKIIYSNANKTDLSAANPSLEATGQSETPATSTPAVLESANNTATASPAASASTTIYKDGTYTTTASYQSPAGQENVEVSLTVAEDKIAKVIVTPQSTDNDGQRYQQNFASGIAGIVVGKPLNSNFDVSEVNGSSLTGTGFTEALATIRQEAKS